MEKEEILRIYITGFGDGIRDTCDAAGIDPSPRLNRLRIPPDVDDVAKRAGVKIGERDDLLAALKKIANALEETERDWCRSEGEKYDGPSDELKEARAFIARIEGGK